MGRKKPLDSDDEEDETEDTEEEKDNVEINRPKTRKRKSTSRRNLEKKDIGKEDSDSDNEENDDDHTPSEQQASSSMFGKFLSRSRSKSPQKSVKKQSKPSVLQKSFRGDKREQKEKDSSDNEHDDVEDDLDNDLEKRGNKAAENETFSEKYKMWEGVKPSSKFSPRHRIFFGLIMAQVLLWMIGVEVLCLFKNACNFGTGQSLRGSSHQIEMSDLVYTNPNIPPHGFLALWLSAGLVVFVILPTSVYLFSTELRQKAILAAVASFGAAGYLFALSVYYFAKMGSASEYVSFSKNPAARFSFQSEDNAIQAAKSSSGSYAGLFLTAAILATLTSLFACFSAKTFPTDFEDGPVYVLLSKEEADDMISRMASAPFSDVKSRSSIPGSRASRSTSSTKSKSKKKDLKKSDPVKNASSFMKEPENSSGMETDDDL